MAGTKESRFARVKFSGQASDTPLRPGLDEEKLTAGVPLTKLIPRKLVHTPELAMISQPRSMAAERFRRLKTTLLNDPDQQPQVIVVTSAAPSEGKSLVAMNLALAFAADRQGEVLLLDADMRRPSVENWLTPPPKLGLSELLAGRTELEHVLLQLQNSPLRIVPAGEPARDPVELMSGEYATAMMHSLRQRFRRIIIDTPPIVPFTDADVIGGSSDGILMVVRADSTRRALLHQSLSSVTSTRVLGLVLNDVTFNLADRENYYGEKNYYRYYDTERRK